MVNNWEVSKLAQPTEQLTNTALLFMKLGKVEQARKIAVKLLKHDRERLAQLSHIDINDSNFNAVMAELNDFEQLIKVWR